ncbi:glycosyltransferase family 4 protein [Bradyrhizobium sp. CB1650]|uniref:glycosyltransferase family 4 protein n=1 Tax=Bradyrhizobium sp. CB1650 TaxID=3039153 RepID=UPI002435450B|nr:glycosyltransferase family 4 protein [Bradyrhizobium sp. CB1650]WGD54989.1 glycosyltransferase family 4 protein [Bradyrhizobium sp. CB1650]
MVLSASTPAVGHVAGAVLIIVENQSVPVDARVWPEATALHQAGYTVSVICPKGQGYDKAYEQIDGVHIYRHPRGVEDSGAVSYLLEYTVALFWEFVLSLKVARRHGFDILHACNPPDLIFLIAIFYKFFFGKKFLFDQHDPAPELYAVKFGRHDFFYRLLLLLERWTFRSADGSLATNPTLKQQAVERGGMPPDRVWIVRNVPDLGRFRQVKPDLSVRRSFRYLVGYVGMMAEQDGVHLLVEAMEHIVKRLHRTDIACLIIGDGAEAGRLRTLTGELGIADNIEFAGFISGDALPAMLAACDIGVVPDPPNACNVMMSMIKVFEYMAVGLPFVLFDLPQARCDAGDAALVVPEPTPQALGEGIVALLENEAARERMRNYGMERARGELQWEVEKHSLLAAYARLAPRHAHDNAA